MLRGGMGKTNANFTKAVLGEEAKEMQTASPAPLREFLKLDT